MDPRLFIAVGACFAFTACQTTKAPITTETSVGVKLPPMEKVEAPSVGYKVIVRQSDGTEGHYEVVAVSDTSLVWRNAEGCEWTQSREFARPFAPSLEWRNCDGSSGTTTIEGHSGDPEWPLRVGKRWRYRATGYTGTAAWDAGQACEVAATARITTVSGTHDTYTVVCTSKWAKYTRYFSPELGAMVRYQRARLAGSVTNDESEMIRVEKPTGS
jgi:hypothetical protein